MDFDQEIDPIPLVQISAFLETSIYFLTSAAADECSEPPLLYICPHHQYIHCGRVDPRHKQHEVDAGV